MLARKYFVAAELLKFQVTMNTPTLSDWSRLLRGIAGAALPRGDALAGAAGEDAAFLAWCAGATPADMPLKEIESAQAALWWACVDATRRVAPILDSLDSQRQALGDTAGSLIPQGLHRSIEVWTDTELSALHALYWLGRRRGEPQWQRQALDAARWHIEHTQPDNATNRPWAVHVFAILNVQHGSSEARLFAEALIHNCQVQLGRPDALSALILNDAADALDES